MGGRDEVNLEVEAGATEDRSGEALLGALLSAQSVAAPKPTTLEGVVLGELLAIADEGRVPLVRFPGQVGSAAVRAKALVDLHEHHIGRQVALMFEAGDPMRPLVMGVVRGSESWPADQRPGNVQVDADGERLIVGAQEQLVLQCGKARITLTKAGKIFIEGTYVLSRSSGVNRIKGGSVQLN